MNRCSHAEIKYFYLCCMRSLIFLLFILFPINAFAQHRQTNYVMPFAEYGYNYTWRHYGSAAAVADFKVAKNFAIEGGLMLSTANVYAADFRLNYEFPLKNCSFYLENRYLDRWFARNETQEYTLALSAGFQNFHWKFQFGLYGKFFGAMGNDSGGGLLFEPWGIIYLGEGKVFRDDHCWNIGGRMSNVNYFMIERVTMPLFTLFGDADVGEKMRIFAEVTAHPSGVFNMQVQFYGIMTQVGIKYRW